MKYGQGEIKKLASKIDIVDYIEQTEELCRRGQNYFIKCPFHKGDDTPSLCIYPGSQTWHCFGCGAGGDIYEWIKRKEHVTFAEAVQKISDTVGIEIHPYVENKTMTFFKSLQKIEEPPKKSEIKRNVLDWNKDYFNKYVNEPPQEWIDEDMTIEALNEYNVRVDKSTNRIVYPVLDVDGNFIGIKGRTKIGNYKALGIQKYMNYTRIGTVDYFQGWQQALEEIQQHKPLIIFEGVKSCIKAWGWGIKNTVASETANISDGQLEILIRAHLPEVIIGWDTDQPLQEIASHPKIQMLKKFTRVSVINDTNHLLGEKMAPVDKGERVFRDLYERRVKL